MAVEVEVTGNGRYAGAKSNITRYSASEESTPAEASDRTGGVGRITFTAVDDPQRLGSVLLLNDTIILHDGDRGEIEGRINSVRGNDGLVDIDADSRLGRLVIDKLAGPVHTTFGDAMRYYLSLGGITTGITIDTSLESIPVVAKGWYGDLWKMITDLCLAHECEITLLKSQVVVRPLRERRALEINNKSVSWSVQNMDLAQEVQAYYYNSEWKVDKLVYPASGDPEDSRVYTVDASQTFQVNVPVDVTLVSIIPPTAQDTVSRTEAVDSVYCAVDKEGDPITAAQWTAGGGSLTVAIGEDQSSLDITIRGMEDVDRSPYRIGVSQGPSDYYSSLRVIGTGLHYRQESITLPTGADETETSRDVGVSVDNIFVNTRADAQEILGNVASAWSAPRRTISISKAYINKPGETDPTFDYATFDEFDAYATANGLTTFNNFDTAWTGKTFQDFDDYWYSLVSNDFEFQVFGNAGGARVQWRRAIYRIRSANITESEVTYDAEADTIFNDWDANADTGAPGMLFNDFDTLYTGLTFADFALVPLPFAPPEYDR